MVAFEDPNHLLVYLGLPIASTAWLATLLRLHGARLVSWLLASMLAVVIYFLLHTYAPDVFGLGGAMLASGTISAALGVLFVVYGIGFFVLFACVAVAGVAILGHNVQLLGDYLGLEPYQAWLVFGVLVVLFLVALRWSCLSELAGLAVSAAVSSTLLMMLLRTTYLETTGPEPRVLACGNDGDDPPGRCPLAFDHAGWLCALVGLLVVQLGWLMHGYLERRRKAQEEEAVLKAHRAAQKVKDKMRKKTKAALKAEALSAKAPSRPQSFWGKVSGKVRASPEPPPPPAGLTLADERIAPHSLTSGKRGLYQSPSVPASSATVRFDTATLSSSSSDASDSD